jgi:hypothetical protein
LGVKTTEELASGDFTITLKPLWAINCLAPLFPQMNLGLASYDFLSFSFHHQSKNSIFLLSL